jgi:hypothetical protein
MMRRPKINKVLCRSIFFPSFHAGFTKLHSHIFFVLGKILEVGETSKSLFGKIWRTRVEYVHHTPGIVQVFVPRDCFQNVEDFGRKTVEDFWRKKMQDFWEKSKGIRGKKLEDFLLEKIKEFFFERISRGISSRIFETNNLRFLEEKVGWFQEEKLGDFWEKRWQISAIIFW